ncbi:gap junction alpha-3 protein-like [Styela clava]
MGWHIVQKLIEQSAEHSTLIGKFWVTSFFIIRLLIVSSMAGNVWGSAQGKFVCNTLSPGCKNVCFNEYSPIALTRYWFLQILCVALPSIIFIVYTAHKMAKVTIVVNARKAREKKEKEVRKKIREEKKKKEKQEMIEAGLNPKRIEELLKDNSDDEKDDKGKDEKMVATKLSEDAPSKLFLAYFFVVLSRLLIEIGFMVGQYHIYTFKFMMPELFQCQHWPCPNVVDCFVSRPKEKTVFICLFFATGCIMVLLNIMELYHISGNFAKAWKERGDDITKLASDGPSFGHHGARHWAPGVGYVEEGLHGYPDASGLPMLHERPMGRRHGRGRRARR